MSKPVISLIIPAYNAEEYLEECLDSVVNQSFLDFKVIFIDDGSTDSTLEIVRKYAMKDQRIQILTQANQGVAHTRNRALNTVDTEYLCFADADDILDEDYLQILYTKAVAGQADIVQCSSMMFWDNMRIPKVLCKEKVLTPLEALHNMFEKEQVNNYVWGKIFRSSVWKDIRFPEDVYCFSDALITIKVIARANKVETISDILYNYRMHNGSITYMMSSQKAEQMKNIFLAQEEWLKTEFPEESWNFSRQNMKAYAVLGYSKVLDGAKKISMYPNK